jgi:hypothetical protein
MTMCLLESTSPYVLTNLKIRPVSFCDLLIADVFSKVDAFFGVFLSGLSTILGKFCSGISVDESLSIFAYFGLFNISVLIDVKIPHTG